MSNENLKKSFCAVPWKEPYVNSIGAFGVCCLEIEKYNKKIYFVNDEFDEHWNSDHIKKTRVQMLSGTLPPQCSVCTKHESIGKDSLRQRRNLYYFGENEPGLQNKKLQEALANTDSHGALKETFLFEGVQFAVGRTCQLGCMMCSDIYSTYIERDYKLLNFKHGFKDKKQIHNFEKRLDQKTFDKKFYNFLKKRIRHIEKLQVTGGEPFLSKKMFEFFEWCAHAGHIENITLWIQTNGMTMPKEKDLIYMQKFKKVCLYVSCDSIGRLEEYTRYPTNWQIKEKNLSIFKKYFDDITLNATLHALNFMGVPKLIDYAIEKEYKITMNLLEEPDFLHMKNLPTQYKNKIASTIEPYKNTAYNKSKWLSQHVTSIINSLKSQGDANKFKKIISTIKSYDNLRKNNYFEIVPDFPRE